MDLKEKYRPRRFQDLVQGLSDPTMEAITLAVQQNNPMQDLCLVGGLGMGKTLLARLIGKRWACWEKNSHLFEPCCKCKGCEAVECTPVSAGLFGYHEFGAESATPKKLIDEIRERLRYKACMGGPRTVTIDEFHYFGPKAQGRFSKFIEGAAHDVQFIICVLEGEAINEAIVPRRCVRYPLRLPTIEASIAHIERIAQSEGKTIESSDAELITSTVGQVPSHCLDILQLALMRSNNHPSIRREDVLAVCDSFAASGASSPGIDRHRKEGAESSDARTGRSLGGSPRVSRTKGATRPHSRISAGIEPH